MADTKTQENWRRHIEKWQNSGLSQAEYCRRNDLSANAFQWQKGRLRKRGTAFVPVKLREENPRIMIGIGDCIRVELLRELDDEEMTRLIRALGALR